MGEEGHGATNVSASTAHCGSAHRSPVEGLAEAVWSVSNGSSPIPRLSEGWCDVRNTRRAGRGSSKTRKTQSGRDLLGRQFFNGQKGGSQVGKTKRGKGTKIMAIADASGLPVALCTEAASPAEVTLVEQTLNSRHVAEKLFYVVADKAYDSDPLREKMREDFMVVCGSLFRFGRLLRGVWVLFLPPLEAGEVCGGMF